MFCVGADAVQLIDASRKKYDAGLRCTSANRDRFYDFETGRYISSDPIGLDGGLNTYGYVGGNPLSRIDPKGLQEQGLLTCTAGPNPICVGSAVVTACKWTFIGIDSLYLMAKSDETCDSCSDESSGDNPPARDIDFIAGKPETAVPGGGLTVEEAADVVRDGGDVIASDESTARDIAREAGNGEPVLDPPHGPGQKPHYHPTDGHGNRLPGHVLF